MWRRCGPLPSYFVYLFLVVAHNLQSVPNPLFGNCAINMSLLSSWSILLLFVIADLCYSVKHWPQIVKAASMISSVFCGQILLKFGILYWIYWDRRF